MFYLENVGTENFRYVTLMFEMSVEQVFPWKQILNGYVIVSFSNSHETTLHKFENSIFDADVILAI